MRRSFLVQRLNRPYPSEQVSVAEVFAFGGGLAGGGLTAEAMDVLRDIFTFDYMGSAEFEFGAVQQALSALAKDAHLLAAGSIEIPYCEVAADFRDKGLAPKGCGTVYILCRESQAPEVAERIRTFAAAKLTKTKEQVRLSNALRPHHEWDSETQGWLELDNGFFFFTSEQMYRKTAELFGTPVG